VESALFRNLRLDDGLAQDSSDVGAARRILSARKVSDVHSFSSLMSAIAYLITCSLSTVRPGCAVRRSQHRSCRVVRARPRPVLTQSGPAQIARMRKEAEKRGLNPD